MGAEEDFAEQEGGLFFADAFFEHIGGGAAMLQQTFYIDRGFLPLGFCGAGGGGFGGSQWLEEW